MILLLILNISLFYEWSVVNILFFYKWIKTFKEKNLNLPLPFWNKSLSNEVSIETGWETGQGIKGGRSTEHEYELSWGFISALKLCGGFEWKCHQPPGVLGIKSSMLLCESDSDLHLEPSKGYHKREEKQEVGGCSMEISKISPKYLDIPWKLYLGIS